MIAKMVICDMKRLLNLNHVKMFNTEKSSFHRTIILRIHLQSDLAIRLDIQV